MVNMRLLLSGARSGALLVLGCLGLWVASGQMAGAQEIEPNDFVPAPDGTNIVLGYYVYGHNEDYSIANGPTVKNSGLEVNLGLARYVHYDYVFGMPAGVQIIQSFGSESAGHIGTTRLGSAFGAGNTTLSGFIWPYASTERKQYLILAAYLYPPDGTYDKYSAVNVGSAAWGGDFQIGWDQGIGEHFSYDLGFDVRKFGDVTSPGGLRGTTDPDFRLEAWASWNWTRAFQTSIGWESLLGGLGYTNGVKNGTSSEFERIRGAASMFVLPNTQVLLELNHDFVAVGGFKQTFGATARVLYVF